MIRAFFLAAALVSAPSYAMSHYHAAPAAKPASSTLVLRDVVWKCGDVTCAAGKSNSRPAIVCALLAKQVGALRSFSASGEAMTPSELEKCNARVN
jgi:hypothetical protein